MNKSLIICLISWLIIHAMPVSAQDIPIGTWRTHASYTRITYLAATDDGVFAASQNGLFYFNNNDGSITRLSKLNGLSGGRYTALAFDYTRNTLVIGYENGFVDLLSGNGEVVTLTDIADASLLTSPAIRHIEISSGRYYLSLSIGVLVISAEEKDIIATYQNLGENGSSLPVYGSAIYNDSLFIAAGSTLLTAPLDGVNLQDFNSYSRISWPYQGSLLRIEAGGNYLVMASDSTLSLYHPDNTFTLLPSAPSSIRGLSAYTNGVLVAGSESVFSYNGNLNQVSGSTVMTPLVAAGNPEDVLYIADIESGLVKKSLATEEAFRPNGILHPVPGKMYSRGGRTFAMYVDPFNPESGREGFSLFQDGRWLNFAFDLPSATKIPLSGIAGGISYYPEDKSYYVGLSKEGILRFAGPDDFSTAEETPFSLATPVISDMHTTSTGELLLTAYHNTQPLFKLNPEGGWESIPVSGALRNSITKATSTFTGEYFLISRPPAGSGGIVGIKSEPALNQVTLTQGGNELPGRLTFDLTEDLDGRLWIGGLAGVAFLAFPSLVFEESVNAQRPVFDQRFLLENESITDITIDGGDRKWLGSFNGAWLFDDSGEEIEQIYHFTTENSPLPSDTIYDISIDGVTGEVFFATSGGLVSYREGATSSSRFFGSVKIFPNPAPSDFGGVIGISGLVTDATVRITNAKGKLIRLLDAEGGTAVWNMRDENGRRAGPGVYVIFAADETGQESIAGKLAIMP
ncbi:hypothetical protein AB9P05_09370 [Roseivirga sp. BDSF3-8]|uniref:type IX secretion system anionic LPS delivery protein PorZ n=1 Tax=Roseivirga sp. BDSF3-8 TaxID=3241598 RepID=UPI003531D091